MYYILRFFRYTQKKGIILVAVDNSSFSRRPTACPRDPLDAADKPRHVGILGPIVNKP